MDNISSIELRQPLFLLLCLAPLIHYLLMYWLSSYALTRQQYDIEMSAWYIASNQSSTKYTLIDFSSLGSFWLLLSIALAGPQIPNFTEINETETSETTIVILDISHSMLTPDIQPNRLQRARMELLYLADQLKPGTRFGVVLYAGTSHLLFTPSYDKNAIRFYLQQIKPGLLPVAGNDLIGAVKMARYIINGNDHNKDHNGSIILISDGDIDQKEKSLEAIKTLKLNISLHVIGIGLSKKTTVPALNSEQAWLKSGNKVVHSKLERAFLQKLAENNNGEYREINDSNIQIDTLYTQSINRDNESSNVLTDWIQLYHGFLLAALLVFILRLRLVG